MEMEERRKNKRLELNAEINLNLLGEEGSSQKRVKVSVQNISKTGLGFSCAEVLEVGEIYEAYLTIWTKEVIHTFLHILRRIQVVSGYHYGASFVGLSEVDASRITIYDTVSEELKNQENKT